MKTLYQFPEYYEIAFSFRNIRREVDVLEEAASRFSKIPVRVFLDIGCGNSPHMEELARRGYGFVGIDISEEMPAFSEEKARRNGVSAQFSKADMVDFRIDRSVDFAFVMLGSLFVRNTAEIVSHFDSVANTLRPGGLYLLDWCIRFDNQESSEDSWEIEKKGVLVGAGFSSRIVDKVEQIYEDTVSLEMLEGGEVRTLESKSVRRAIFPQEFLFFVSARKDFEFLGWWNDWDLSSPLRGDRKINRPIVLLRRTEEEKRAKLPPSPWR